MEFERYFFANNGKPIIYKNEIIFLYDSIELKSKISYLKIKLISTNSKYRQGVFLFSKSVIEVEEIQYKTGVILWSDTFEKELEIKILPKKKHFLLKLSNLWDYGEGRIQFGHNGAAMKSKKEGNIITYFCNDGIADDDFDDLIFQVDISNV